MQLLAYLEGKFKVCNSTELCSCEVDKCFFLIFIEVHVHRAGGTYLNLVRTIIYAKLKFSKLESFLLSPSKLGQDQSLCAYKFSRPWCISMYITSKFIELMTENDLIWFILLFTFQFNVINSNVLLCDFGLLFMEQKIEIYDL